MPLKPRLVAAPLTKKSPPQPHAAQPNIGDVTPEYVMSRIISYGIADDQYPPYRVQ